jgi:hypothetical protein
MFEQTFKNIDDILHKDAGCGSELDYVEQTSWVLFLKYLDDLEQDKQTEAELTEKAYQPIISAQFFLGLLFIKSVALNTSFSFTLSKAICFGKNCLNSPL